MKPPTRRGFTLTGPHRDTTFTGIRHPAARTWTVTAQADSAPALDVAGAAPSIP